jgi:drug/metabolite transporter (DMT)-like permease
MRPKFAALIVFLVVMAWQFRNNRAVFFLVIGTLFPAGAMLFGDRIPDRVLQSLALAWAACMLLAAASAASKLFQYLKKKRNATAPHAGKAHQS